MTFAMLLHRRSALFGLASLSLPPLLASPAHASSLIGLTLEQLVLESARVIYGTPVSVESHWERVAGKKRIVTLTRLVETRVLDRDDDPTEQLAMTFGGRVEDVAQTVFGEAQLRVGTPSVVFLGRERNGARRVVGMSQGAYEVRRSSGRSFLHRSGAVPELVRRMPRAELAVEALDGRTIDECQALIRGVRP